MNTEGGQTLRGREDTESSLDLLTELINFSFSISKSDLKHLRWPKGGADTEGSSHSKMGVRF